MSDLISPLSPELKHISYLIEKRISFKRVFLLGLVQGVGSALGATIIAGIVFALLIKFVHQTGYFSFLEQFLNPRGLDKSIEYSEY